MSTATINDHRTSRIDRKATEKSRAVLDGRAEEKAARWWMYRQIAVEPDFVGEVVGKQYRTRIDDATIYRIEVTIRNQLVGKVVGVSGSKPDLDLQRVAEGSSLCGWARSYLRTMARYTVSDMARGDSFDLGYNLPADETARLGHASLVGQSPVMNPEDVIDAGSESDMSILLDALDATQVRLKSSVRGRPSVASLHEEAEALCQMLDVPMPRRIGPDDKPVMRALMDAPDAAVRQVLAKLVARLDPLAPTRKSKPVHESVDDAVEALSDATDGITYEQARRVHLRPTGLVRLWIGSSVHDRLSPPRTHIDEAVRRVNSELEGHNGLLRLGFNLVHSAVRSNCELVAGEFGGGDVRRLTDEEHDEAHEALQKAASKVADEAPDVFGDSVEAVEQAVLDLFDDISNEVLVEGDLET